MSKGGKTAEQLMSELQSDPTFRKREEERDQRRLQRELEYARILAPILRKLADIGYKAASMEGLVDAFAPLPPPAVEILLSSLANVVDERLKESIVRALGAAEQPFDGTPLVECFDGTSDEGLKFAVLNTIAFVKPYSIDHWLDAARGTWIEDKLRQLS
jgi:hypothetical protein